jgi:hypothetical protein
MDIHYLDPLSRGWGRMKKALFNPFDLKKWFVVGFTAFLAGLTEGPGGGGGGKGIKNDFGDKCNLDGVIEAPRNALNWLMDSPERIVLITLVTLIVLVFILIIVWLSSRGKFMFLHNVVHNRAEVAKPWRVFSNEGNSLCLWTIGFGLVCIVCFALFAILGFNLLTRIHYGEIAAADVILWIVGLSFLFLVSILVIGYVRLFLDDFIVPIMYKHKITASDAWRKFGPIFKTHAIHFILYGILLFLIYLAIGVAVILVGVFTCCIGFFLLVIPYINSVVTLPISYTLRGFSAEFLAQFGDKYNVFQKTQNTVKKK